MTFAERLAAFVLGWLRTEELPAAALRGLEEGLTSSELAALAGAPRNAPPSELLARWERALHELGRTLPPRAEAGRLLRDHLARQVADGALAPVEGATALVRLAHELTDVLPDRRFAGDGLGVAEVLGILSCHDEAPEAGGPDRSRIEDELRAACRRVGGHRRRVANATRRGRGTRACRSRTPRGRRRRPWW